MNADKSLKMVFGMFVIIILSAAFIVAIANSLSPSVSSQPVVSESTNIASARYGTANNINTSKVFTLTMSPAATSNLSIDTFSLTNSTGAIATLDTDYKVYLNNGTFSLLNTSFWVNTRTNTSLSNYSYYSSSYIQDAASRSMMGMIVFFTAVGALFAVIAYLNWDYIKKWFG